MSSFSPGATTGGMRPLFRALDQLFPVPSILKHCSAGVDISDASIKWALFEHVHGRAEMRSIGSMPLSSGVVTKGVIKDAQALINALAELVRRGVTAAHVALPEEEAYVFTMSVPSHSSREQIMSMIEFEFEGRVPISPQTAEFDFERIQGTRARGTEEIGVVAFSRDTTAGYASAFRNAGIRLLSLELEARSIARATMPERNPEDIPDVTLVLDFGRWRSGIAVLKNNIPIFTATVDIGGETITRSLVKQLSIEKKEAERIKNEEGLTADEKHDRLALEVTTVVVSALADEVVRHFRFWDTRKSNDDEDVTPVSRVLLVGGSANLCGLDEYLARRVQVPVARADVWQRAFSYGEYIPPIQSRASLAYATAIGLALRGCAPNSLINT